MLSVLRTVSALNQKEHAAETRKWTNCRERAQVWDKKEREEEKEINRAVLTKTNKTLRCTQVTLHRNLFAEA
jgi:hypothetical protein